LTACPVCPRHCLLEEGGLPGCCRARALRDGESKPLGYGKLTSLALDPIEKKPLSFFRPGSRVLSCGSFGCNMNCYFCQNSGISMADEQGVAHTDVSPGQLCALAEAQVSRGNIGVAFTYNEPLVAYEYIVDTGRLLKARGLCTVVVTNGCFCLDAMGDLMDIVDAFNIDLKGFTDSWYHRLGGDLATVKAFIQEAVQHAHVELTTLVVPGQNDSEEEISALAAWVASLDRDIPLHLSRFFPRHRAAEPHPTDRQALLYLCAVAERHLRRVVPGNI
jgi:pyruvate formate lyase activating enzyme